MLGSLGLPLLAHSAIAADKSVLVITSSAVPAYAEAVEALLCQLRTETHTTVFDLASAQAKLSDVLAKVRPNAFVAVGGQAEEAVNAMAVFAPVITTMVLRPSERPTQKNRAPSITVMLDVPIATVSQQVRNLFPGARLGVIATRGSGELTDREMAAQIVVCNGPEDLLSAFATLRGQVDFVWCRPDNSLYDAATVRSLIMASLRLQLPLVGFSSSFVRAGAAAGVWADYREIGLQTADAVRRCLARQPNAATSEAPRKLKIAVNERVVRLMGLAYKASASKEVVILR